MTEIPDGGGFIAAVMAIIGGGVWAKRAISAANKATTADDVFSSIQEGYTTEVVRLQKLVALIGPLSIKLAEHEGGEEAVRALLESVHLCDQCKERNGPIIECIRVRMNKLAPALAQTPIAVIDPLDMEIRKVINEFHSKQYRNDPPV